MDKELESKFVEKFIAKDKRKRVLHELNDDKKRWKALSRFACNLEEMVEKDTIVFYGRKMKMEEAVDKLQKLVKTEDCYFLCFDKKASCYMNLRVCLDKYYFEGPSIFICEEKAVLIVAEQEVGAPEKIILFSH